MKYYKFLRTGLKSENGNMTWKLGKWEKYEGEIEMCEKGFHCSVQPYDAFTYVQGEVLAEVEVRGENEKQGDKEVWSEMRLIRAWKWDEKASLKLAIFSAELVLPNYEKLYSDKAPRLAIEAAKKVLFKDTKANRDAAWSAESAAWSAAESARSAESAESAARSAARSAESAESAARSAAWSARSAAESAAWSAARSAESAARSAARSAESAARSAESAAWSAARSAAWSAWSAARSAARSAESAARSAAIKKIRKKFVEITKELKPYQESRWVK